MAQRTVTHDRYGHLLPALTDARREVLKAKTPNVLQRRRIASILEDLYDVLLRRDINADVTVAFKVQDGVIQASVEAGVVRHYRWQPEGE